MILITTSHRPTRRVRSLCNDLARSVPGLLRVNRGKMNLYEVAERALEMGSDRFIVVDRWKGGPGRIRLFKIIDEEVKEVPPRLYVSGVKLRREFNIPREWVREKINLLYLEDSREENLEIIEFRSVLANFLQIKALGDRAETMGYEACMSITAGGDSWAVISFFRMPGRVEIGPRIKISHAVWSV